MQTRAVVVLCGWLTMIAWGCSPAEEGDADAAVRRDSGTSARNDAGPAPRRDSGTSARPDAAAVPSGGCGTAPAATGVLERTVTVDGTERTYLLEIPSGVTGSTPLPLVFAFHGRGGGSQDASNFGLQGAASAAGDQAIFVFPQALVYPGEGATGWEISCDGYDMEFMAAVYDATIEETCIDTDRVFATGFSWGADMTIALGCCRHDVFRAIAPTSGTAWGNWRDACPTDGPAFRVTIGVSDGFYSVEDVQGATDHYRSLHGCAATTHPADPDPPCVAYDGCDEPVIQCTYPGLTHSFPPDGAQHIWTFFAGF